MTIIVLKKLEDFKSIINNANQLVFWKIEEASGNLLIYASSDSVYCLRLNVNEPEGLELWLQSNFENVMEIKDLI